MDFETNFVMFNKNINKHENFKEETKI